MSTHNLSADHFLAPQTISLGANPPDPPVVTGTGTGTGTGTPSGASPPAAANDSRPVVDTATLASADFDVDVHSGFLPPSAPLRRLSDPGFDAWEAALHQIQTIISETNQHGRVPRKRIEEQVHLWKTHVVSKMPTLKIGPLLMDITELRRAHLVLAFLTHAFVHSDSLILLKPAPEAAVTVPATLAIPFCQISHALDVPPVLTYADTVLYNWYFKNPALGFTASNLEITTTFTQTESEKHFYKTSVLVEALGPACLKLMRSSLDEAFMGDSTSIKRIGINLAKLSAQIDRISKALGDVRVGCDPKTFYWHIRPWFNAGTWTWEGVLEPTTFGVGEEERRPWRVTAFGGPSAGQSTLIHAIDVFLGINHQPSRQEIQAGIQAEETFMDRMSTYMPHHHRLFLGHLSQSCLADQDRYSPKPHLIRAIVLHHTHDEGWSLKNNYNACIQSLARLRHTHTNIVSLFIISQKNSKNHSSHTSASKGVDAPHQSNSNQHETSGSNTTEAKNSAPTSAKNHETIDVHKQVLKGTGGTDLSKFLKRCKLRTTEALLVDD